MNRDIKFRGKRLDNGEWIYGSLRIYDAEDYIGYYITELEHWGSGYEVDPKTVGQLVYKLRGTQEVYEDDIIYSSHVEDQKAGPVKWSDHHHAYIIDYPRENGTDRWQHMHGKEHCYKVIGNTHDNPDLVEAKL